jgi:glycosyltransferase involved in cell wall biosynthesis
MSRIRSRISIAIPTRDRPQSLKATLESLDRQTQGSFDIVVANSGQIAVEHLLSSFPRLDAQYLRRSNDSPSEENWKAAVEGCKSDFVVTLHDDDTLAPRFIEARLAIQCDEPHP